MPIHNRHKTEKHNESTDIDQEGFHRSPLPDTPRNLVMGSIGKTRAIGPLHMACLVANCAWQTPEQFVELIQSRIRFPGPGTPGRSEGDA